MKTNDPEHLAFARKRDFPFQCDPRLFSHEQYGLVVRWGHWYQALASGLVKPLSEAQRDFVLAVNGDTPPEEKHAQAWWRYSRRLRIEADHGEAMHTSYQIDADTFYNREMVKQQRRITFSTNLKEHRRE